MRTLYEKLSLVVFAFFLLGLFTLCGLCLKLLIFPLLFVHRPTAVRLVNPLIRFWGANFFHKGVTIVGVRLEQSGFKPEPGKPYLIISNHQSVIDIAMLFWVFRKSHIKFVMKKELQWGIPNISPATRYARFAFLDRQAGLGAAEEILGPFCQAAREEGTGVVIFPEGTRSRDGNLRRFKPAGVMFLAQHLDYEVLVATLNGTWRAATPVGMYHNLPGIPIKLHIEEPQPIRAFRADPKGFLETVRRTMNERLAIFRGEALSSEAMLEEKPADERPQAGGQG